MKKINLLSILLSIIAIVLSVLTIFYLKLYNSKESNLQEKSRITLKDFSISKISFSKESHEYSYSDLDYITYDGEADISCKDKKNDYLLIYKITPISGGSIEQHPDTYYGIEIIHKGKGTINTYDYGDNIEKPIYEIEAISYIKLDR